MLLIDAANVIGSRPDGWWRDRAGAARRFVEQLREAAREGRVPLPAVVVLEGAARAGCAEGVADGVCVVHAAHGGDDELVHQIRDRREKVVLITADRGLRARAAELGAETFGPSWLTERLQPS